MKLISILTEASGKKWTSLSEKYQKLSNDKVVYRKLYNKLEPDRAYVATINVAYNTYSTGQNCEVYLDISKNGLYGLDDKRILLLLEFRADFLFSGVADITQYITKVNNSTVTHKITDVHLKIPSSVLEYNNRYCTLYHKLLLNSPTFGEQGILDYFFIDVNRVTTLNNIIQLKDDALPVVEDKQGRRLELQ